MDRFSKADDDAIRASVMKKNKKTWRHIRGEVKEWVLEKLLPVGRGETDVND